jgi:CubicO group peptidase (beta-lactamase class C family)/effector-binding domain-containing protein
MCLRSWLVLGPIPVGEAGRAAGETTQKAAFERDELLARGGLAEAAPQEGQTFTLSGQLLKWQRLDSKSDIVDLGAIFGRENLVAYAFAEINMPEARSVLFGLGSDDAIKVWLNGTLIHENWIARGTRLDDDILELKLRQGVNHLLLKIQNRGGDWGFAVRPIDSARFHERLSEMVIAGDLGALQRVAPLATGANAPGKYGLTSYQWAKVYGRKTIVKLLEAQGADATIPPPPPEAVVDAIFKDVVHPGQPGAAVLVAKDGNILLDRAYGLADVERGIPVTAETVFNLASITKPFTAAATLKLQEEKRLSVDDTLSKYIPDYPRGNEITIRHLLTHTSGIREKLGGPATLATATYPANRDYLIALFKYLPLDFDPGSQYAYSNSGYYLLGYIIEKVSGESYAEYLRDAFFKPLGMNHTGIYQPGESGKAMPYLYRENKLEGLQKTEVVHPTRIGGNGALDSTAEDLYRWTEGYFNARVLGETSIQAALTPAVHGGVAISRPRTGGYGYGWGIGRLRGLREVFHTGGSLGYSCALYRYPDEHFTVIILTNSTAPIPTYDLSGTAQMIGQLYLHDRMELRDEPKPNPRVDARSYDSYAGHYAQGSGGVVSVTREGNRLFAQSTGHPRIELFPKSETVFFYDPRVFDAQIEFVRNDRGKVTGLIHFIDGDAINTPRLPDVPPEVSAGYIGWYRLRSGEPMQITREGSALFAQVTGQPRLELFPRSETKFFITEAKVTVEFVKGTDGKFAKAVLVQDGSAVEAPKIEAAQDRVTAPPAATSSTASSALQPQARQLPPMQAIVIPMTGSYALHPEAIELITAYVASKGVSPAGPLFGRYLNSPATVPESELRWEVGLPVPEGTTAASPFEIRKFDDPLMVTAIVAGPHTQPKPWPELFQWLGKNGYVPAGPTMESWLDGPSTEMRIAVKPAK